MVLTIVPDDAPVWYYFSRHHLSDQYLFDIKKRPFRDALVLVNGQRGETLASTLAQRQSFTEILDLPSARLVYQQNHYAIYEVPHR